MRGCAGWTLVVGLAACGGGGPDAAAEPAPVDTVPAVVAPTLADVVKVETAGKPGAVTFSVTVHSPDTGCDRYADWWEIVRADGTLAFRRVLNHSHAGEQPFRRSGGPVDVSTDEVLWVRAHLKPGGYGGVVMTGTVAGGFVVGTPAEGFGAGLEETEPLPVECLF